MWGTSWLCTLLKGQWRFSGIDVRVLLGHGFQASALLLMHLLVQPSDRAAGQGPERGLGIAGCVLGTDVGLTVHAGCWMLQYEEERRQGRVQHAPFTF